MWISQILTRGIAKIHRWLARKVCAQQWHAIDFAPHRWPWDQTILGGFRMYCRRCGETLGYIP